MGSRVRVPPRSPINQRFMSHLALEQSFGDALRIQKGDLHAKAGRRALAADQLKGISAWAAEQVLAVTRPEAIRGMIDTMLYILATVVAGKDRHLSMTLPPSDDTSIHPGGDGCVQCLLFRGRLSTARKAQFTVHYLQMDKKPRRIFRRPHTVTFLDLASRFIRSGYSFVEIG